MDRSPGCLSAARGFLAASSLPVSLSAGVFQYVAFLLAGMQVNVAACVIACMLTFAVYSMNNLADSKEDAVNVPERAAVARHREIVLSLSATAYLISIVQGWRLFGPVGLLYLVPALIGLIYSFRVPGLPRLKEITGAKALVVALAWAVTMCTPLIYAGVSQTTGLIVGAWIFSQIYIDCILFDMRDVIGDRMNGIRTLPAIWGERRTVATLIGFNGLFIALVPLIKLPILALIMVLYRSLCISYFSQRRDQLVMDLFLENNWFVVLAVFEILKAVTVV